MNASVTQSTGHTAAYLNFAREVRTRDDVQNDLRSVALSENFVPEITQYLVKISETMREVRENIENAQDRSKKYADLKRRPIPEFQLGDLVLVCSYVLSKSAKFTPKRDGHTKFVLKSVRRLMKLVRMTMTLHLLNTISDLTPYSQTSRDDHPRKR